MAGNLFKVTVVQHWVYDCWIGPGGVPCDRDTPGARFVKSRKVRAGTPGAKKVKKKSTKWYGRVPGSRKPVPLSANKVAAQQLLAELVRKTELRRAGLGDPFEEHRKRPLDEHLAEWEAALLASGVTAKHVRQTVSCARRVIEGCGFIFADDLSASRAQRWVAGLLGQRRTLPPLDPAKEWYKKSELASAVGVKPSAVPVLVRHHRLPA